MEQERNLISKSRVSRATGWSFAGELAAKLISPVTNMILARILAPEVFGVVATVNMVVSLADVFTEAGFQLYLIQHPFADEDELHRYASSAFWVSVLFGVLMCAGIAIFRTPIAALVGSPGYETALVVASLAIPITAAISILQALYRRRLDYKPLFLRRILALLVPLLVTLPLALCGLGVWALIIGTLSGKIVNCLVLLINRRYHPKFVCRLTHVLHMAPFCLVTIVSYFLSWATNWIDIFIIGNMLGPYYTGLYKNSQATVIGIITIFTAAITPVLFSVLCRHADDDQTFVKTMNQFTQRLGIFLLPMGFGILVCRRLITYVMLGANWMEASELIGVWGLATAFSAVYATYNREACRAKGKPHLNIVAQLVALSAIIPASYFGARAGFGTLIYLRSAAILALILGYCLVISIALHLNPLRWYAGTLPSLLCSVIMAAVLLLLKQLNGALWFEFVLIAVGIVLYFALLALFPSRRTMICEWLKKGKSIAGRLIRRSKSAPK